jgi:hypothetical protein
MTYHAAMALCWLCIFASAALYLAWLIWREWCGHGTQADCLKRYQDARMREEMRK